MMAITARACFVDITNMTPWLSGQLNIVREENETGCMQQVFCQAVITWIWRNGVPNVTEKWQGQAGKTAEVLTRGNTR